MDPFVSFAWKCINGVLHNGEDLWKACPDWGLQPHKSSETDIHLVLLYPQPSETNMWMSVQKASHS